MTVRQKVDTEEITQADQAKKTEKKSDMQTWQLSYRVILSSHLCLVMFACLPGRQTEQNTV